MSIIQDALRRKAKEEAERPASRVRDAVPAPPPVYAPPPAPRPDTRAAPGPAPYAYAPVSRRRRRGRWVLPVMLGLALLVTAGAAAWYYLDYRGGAAMLLASGGNSISAPADTIPPETVVDPEAADWPVIRLGSLARASGGRSSAILNGRLYLVGDKIEGATLVEVAENGVTLELKGQSLFLRVGDATLAP